MEEKNNTKTLYIIIGILLFIIGLGLGYILFGNNKTELVSTTEEAEKIENNENTKIEDIETETIEPSKEETIQKGKLKDDLKLGEKDTKTVILNNKKLEIEYGTKDDEKAGITYLKLNGNTVYELAPNGFNNIRYEVFKGKDNKDYLLLQYYLWSDYGFIYNDEGKELFKMNSDLKDEDCLSIFKDETKEKIYIENNTVYYYSYKKGTFDKNKYTAKLELIEVTVNNNKITEKETNIVEDATVGQCA